MDINPSRILTLCLSLTTAFVLLLIGILDAQKIPLMGDELTTYYLSRLPNSDSLFNALKNGADSHGAFPHYTLHLWMKANLPPQIWGRIPSILLWIATLFILTSLLNRNLSYPKSLALSLTLFLWPETHRHFAEIRSYGWVALLITLQIALLCSYTTHPKKTTLLWLFLSSALSFLTHPMAVAYSGAACLATTLLLSPSHPPIQALKLPLTWGLGSLALLPWLPHLLGQTLSTMTPETRWAQPPSLPLLWEFGHPNPALLFLFMLLFLLPTNIPSETNKTIPKVWIAIGGTLAFLPIPLWLASQFTNPLLTERYILPSQIGWILLCGGLLTIKKPSNSQNKTPQGDIFSRVVSLLTIPLLLGAIGSFPPIPRVTTGGFHNQTNPWADIGLQEKKYFSEELPILCESSTTYLPRKFYNTAPLTYTLALPKKSQGVYKMDAIMSRALSQEDSSQSVMPLESFLKSHKKFYLLNEPQNPLDQEIPPHYSRKILNPENDKNSLRLELIENPNTL